MSGLLASLRAHWRDPLYRNGYLLMLNSVTGAVFGFAFWLAVARVFADDAAVGYGAAVVSAMTLLALLGKFGLDAALVRYVPRATREARVRLLVVGVAGASAATAALALLFIATLPSVIEDLGGLRGDPVAGGLFALFAAAISAAWIFDAYFVAERAAHFSLLRNVVFNAVKLGLPFLVLFHRTPFGIPAAWGVGVAASLALSVALAPLLLRRATGTARIPGTREIVRYSSLNYVQNVADFLPGLVLPLLVLHVLGRGPNAYFYVAWTFAFIAFLASKSISQSTFAEMSHDGRGVVKHLRKAALQNVVVLVPFVAGVLLLGRPLLGLYGPAYPEHGFPLLVLLALSALPVAVNALYLTFLKARNANLELVVLPVATLVLTFAVATPLLYERGLVGVGLGWLAANALVALYSGYRLATVPRRFEIPHDPARGERKSAAADFRSPRATTEAGRVARHRPPLVTAPAFFAAARAADARQSETEVGATPTSVSSTPPLAPKPRLSVVLLTRNEAANVRDALGSLLSQEERALEVVVVDSASADGTVDLARAVAKDDARVRVLASPTHLTIGEARNLGLREARGEAIAFMSADATAAPGWAAAALAGLADADLVYGRQEHAPPALTVAAVVRGLRYHHFDRADLPPDAYASNVNAAIRRDVFGRVRYVSDGPASALDDVLFTAEAMTLGYRVAYRADMLVRHKDASTLRQELVKNRREGYGWGLLAPRLGVHRAILAWGAALPGVAVLAVLWPAPATLALALLALYAPALRRAVRAGRRYLARAPLALAGAVLASPAFDLAFLFHYARGLRHRRGDLSGLVRPQGV